MRNKHLFLFAYTLLATLTLSFTSCSSDDGDDNTTPPVVEHQSVINMMKGSYENATKFGKLYINESNNFTLEGYRDGIIAPVGKIKGLANISGFPKSGYTHQTAALKGYGYIFYNRNNEETSDDKYCRLYIEDEINDKAGNILGYKVVYETPFYGKDQDIKLPKYEFAYDSNGGRDTLPFTDEEPMIIDYEDSHNDWGYIDDYKIDNYYMPAVKGIIIVAHASDSIYATCDTITLKTKYGKQKTIKVTRGAAESRLSFESFADPTYIPFYGGTEYIELDTNIPFDKIEIDNSKGKWCKATLENYKEYGYRFKRLVITAESNETGEQRSGSITLKYKDGTQSATINIVQDAPYFECNYNTENYYSTNYYSGTRSIFYKSNIENLKTESNVDWIYDLGFNYSNELHFYCDGNYSGQIREGIITIYDESGEVIHSIKVVQNA